MCARAPRMLKLLCLASCSMLLLLLTFTVAQSTAGSRNDAMRARESGLHMRDASNIDNGMMPPEMGGVGGEVAAGFAGAMPAPAMLMEEDAAMDQGAYYPGDFDMPNTMRKSAARGVGRPEAALATASRTTTGSFGGDREEGRPDHTQSSGPLLIRQGNMQLLVESIALAMTSIEGITTSAGGYVSASNTHSEPRQYFRKEAGEGETGKTTSQWINTVVSGTLTLRIPGNKFDEVRKRIHETAKDVITEFINVQDVTAQYTDIVTRIKVKETTLNQLEAVSSCCSRVLVVRSW